MRAGPIAGIALAAAFSQQLHAQEITGRITADGIPLPAVVITLLDSSGATIARALSSNDGRYRLPPTTRGASVRTTRIGFRPREVRLVSPSQVVDIALERLPTMLSAVRVIDQPGCPSRRDRAQAFALWEQARAAFLSTVVARETDRVALERLLFYRIVGEKRSGVLTQVVQRDTGGSRPFGAARTARQFVELGFHERRTDTYFAPDADVLLDEAFTAGYCLRLANRESSRPRQVGIRFEPSARRRFRVDIEGTVWLDTAARALSDVEFRYLGLGRELESLGLGGHVLFSTLPRGYPAVTRWSMRVDAPTALVAFGREGLPVLRPGSVELHELGGELVRARWSDTSWTTTLGRVSGRVMQDTLPASDVVVRLIGTPYSARTDSAGNFAMDGLLSGRYTFSVPHPELNAIGFEVTRGQSFVSNHDSQRVEVQLPTSLDFLHVKCPGARKDTTSVMIAGRVFANDKPAVSARVNLFQRDSGLSVWERIHNDFTGRQSMFYLAQDGVTGSGGAFFICKVESSRLFRIDALGDDEQRGSTTLRTDIPGKRVYPVRIDIP